MPYTYDYPMASTTTDLVILTLRAGRLHVLLIERGEEPFEGMWALPGGHINLHPDPTKTERAIAAAHRELEEETGLPNGTCRLVRYGTFDDPGRDPRGNYTTSVFATFIGPHLFRFIKPGDDARKAEWFPVDELPPLAFDHAEIMADTLARVMKDILSTDISFDLLPAEFMVSDLRNLYEAVKGESIDKSNFHRRFMRLVEDGIVEPTGTKRAGANLYRRAS